MSESMSKVDRALEIAVIDWLQWAEFPEHIAKPDMPRLALELIDKRKKENQRLRQLVKDLIREWESGRVYAPSDKLKIYERAKKEVGDE